jgi:hypothetical protein
MPKQHEEAKGLVRSVIKAEIVDENLNRTIDFDGERVHIADENGTGIRFSLPDRQVAFVLKSGRLFQRDYEDPRYAKQRNYRGDIEEVDTQAFVNRVVCECGEARWVKNADLFQVKKCKPCTYKERMERRRLKRRAS